jgi:hypothetical protein
MRTLLFKFVENNKKLRKYLHVIAVVYFIYMTVQKHRAKKATEG